ncbi:MAG: alpha/beta fold hydrolase [Anaerolineae bacterium]|nr:alpha/beta fold hydrolase [Anaerolineae bacterium]
MCLITLAFAFAGAPLTPALAQDGDGPALVPFEDEAYGIQGVIPEGWAQRGPGVYARGSGAGDFAVLALQAVPLAPDVLWPSLRQQLLLNDTPESTGEYETPALTWTLYQVDVAAPGATLRVDLGLAQKDGKTYVALLQTNPEDYETLHEGVFLPVLDALAPLTASTEDLPYTVEDVSIENGDVTLAGSLSLPDTEGRHPAVVLMSGSGAQDRDEMVIPGFPIFRLIADHLTRQGIAVLRYDDRGTGKSTGEYASATVQELASDGQAAVDYLKTRADINPDQIGVMGHSEGGLYAALMGANPESGVAFIVSMAGPAVNGKDVLLVQNEMVLKASGASDELIQNQLDFLNRVYPLVEARDWQAVEQAVRESALSQWELLTDAERAQSGADSAEALADQAAAQFRDIYSTDWFASFLEYDPAVDWARTTVPVLGVFGGKDVQVDPEQNAPALRAALEAAGNADVEIVVIEDANHLFQKADTGGVDEYMALPAEFTPEFLPTVSDWILEHVTVVE